MSASCDEIRALIQVHSDGELELPRALALEQHLENCAACTGVLHRQRALSMALRGAPYHRMPAHLRTRLHAQLPLAPVPAPAPAPERPPSARRGHSEVLRWALPLAASLLLVMGLNFFAAGQRADEALITELVDSHVRSLQGEHLADVISSDRHTVKPWFAGKLDYSPPVRDLAADDFPLTGGRLDHVAHRSVAALVYQHRKHVINVYVWPATGGDASARTLTRDGYSQVHWRSGGMEWWAISDLNEAELGHFAALLMKAAAIEPATPVPAA